MERLASRAAQLLSTARHAVALTGAGISTPSGIPDFRSPSAGLWAHADPFEVASRWAFERHPERFYAWVQPLAVAIATAHPNEAHRALAALERAGLIHAVITQNIDGLHQRAGSHNVLEVHGHLREATCLACLATWPGEELLERFVSTGSAPRCPCGGVLKPNVVLFGDPLPTEVLQAAQRAVAECDVMLVAGSSLTVTPVGDWPAEVLTHGAELIIVNRTPTPLDDEATVVMHADVSQALPAIARLAGVKTSIFRQKMWQQIDRVLDRLVPRV